jgi:hypothetical protein
MSNNLTDKNINMRGSETYVANILEKSLIKTHSKAVYGISDSICIGITFFLKVFLCMFILMILSE